MSDEDAYLAAFIINNDRKELNQYERGRWYKLLMKRFPEKFPSQRALSPYVAVNQSTIVRDIQYYEANAPKTPVNQHDADGIMDVSESTRGEANANTKDKNTTQTQTGTPSDIPSEFVDRQIRKFPAKMQDELRSQAAKEGLTAEQTRERGEILVIIGKVPERYRASLLEEARTQCWDIEQTEKVANEFIIKMPSDEEAEALWLAAGQKELRQEESKKRGLLKKGTVKVEKKEKLTKFYSETVLKIVIDRFGRQQKPDMILKIARKLCDLAVQTLTPEQLQEILKKISEAG
jgi:leucyl aminopeptidase